MAIVVKGIASCLLCKVAHDSLSTVGLRTVIRRAARFNMTVLAPEKRMDLRQEVRKTKALERSSRQGPDFVTGMDIFTEVLADNSPPSALDVLLSSAYK